ncbi:MAG TPA: alpha/beta hydrolase [Solirubrobacteraceae bacterium]|jgi:acetyl esterase|nr:alpha/beta hydrolase [Solirubrobacteraceae bacterium]
MSHQLDPQAQALLEVMQAAGGAQPYELPVEQARERMRGAFITRGEPLALHAVQDVLLPSPGGPLALRIYRPATGRLPVALFLHGGGWTLNDLDTHDRLCRRIARRSGWMLASLDFRRAPEHQHPAALQDALLAYRWLLDNAPRIGADGSCVALIGESSGGATATCLALLLRDLGAQMPVLQALAYPIIDLSEDWPSYQERGEGYTLDVKFVRWSLANYMPGAHEPDDPYLFALAAENLAGVSPVFLMTAEFDPLRDQGIAYAHRLQNSSVAVEHVHVEDQMHGFLLLDRAVARAGELIDRLADALSRAAGGL